jgi:hypothetical protein
VKRLTVFFFCACLIYPVFAAAPAFLLAEPAVSFLSGLVLRSAGRQALISVGVAANDASWIIRLSSLIQRAAVILRIAVSDTEEYELPLQSDIPVPKPVDDIGMDPSSMGALVNPVPYTHDFLRYKVTGTDICQIGNSPGIAAGVYSLSQILAECNNIILTYSPVNPYTGQVFQPWRLTRVKDNEIYEASYTSCYRSPGCGTHVENNLYVENLLLETSETNPNNRIYHEMEGFFVEEIDGVKRYVFSPQGFLTPDTTDPDWTEQEKESYSNPENNPVIIRFVDSSGKIVQLLATRFGTVVQAFTQSGNDVLARQFELNSQAAVVAVNEYMLQSKGLQEAAEEALPDLKGMLNPQTRPQTGESTDPGTFPWTGNDYARIYEAGAAADRIVDALEFEGPMPYPENIEPPDSEEQEELIRDLPEPEENLNDLLPNMSPGDFVECRPLELNSNVSVFGWHARSELDLCEGFRVVNAVLSWLFGVVTIIYLWRRFTRRRKVTR